MSAAWKARSVLSAWNLAAILLIGAISLIVMSSITPPTQQTHWRNFSNRPIEVAADEPRDLRRDVPEQPRDITPLREWSPLAILATTTLADLLTLPLVANPFSAMRTSLRWWSSDEFEDGVAHAWQNRLGRWPVDSFFPPCCWKAANAGGRHMRSSS